MTMFVCYNYADNFLRLCTETDESHTCLTLAKNSAIMEKLFPMIALKSTTVTLHLLSALQLRGNNLMVTLKSNNQNIPDGYTKI